MNQTIATTSKRRHLSLNENDLIGFVGFFLIAIAWSPVFPGVFKIPTSMMCFPLLLFSVVYLYSKNTISRFLVAILLLMIFCIILITSITGSSIYLNRYITIPLAIIFCSLLSRNSRALDATCYLLTGFAIISIILSIVASLYALSGGSYIFSFINPDGRDNYLFLTSLSNSFVGNVIRPSFIYDEPGAYSFVLSFIVIFRELLRKNRTASWFIMIGGLVTFSFIHSILLIIYILFNVKFAKLSLLLPLSIIAALQIGPLDELDFFVGRFLISDGEVAGDNRSDQILNYLDVVDGDMVLYGDYKCHSRPDRQCAEHGSISSSPVTPIYRGGLFYFCVQMVVHLILVYSAIKNRAHLLVAVLLTLLLLQRPFFESYGYQLMIFISVFILMAGKNAQPIRSTISAH